MFKDILDLLIFKPKSIEYYQRYSMLQIVLIIMALGFMMGTIAPINNAKLTINYLFSFLGIITILLVVAVFFKYWLVIKEKQVRFIAIFSLVLLTSAIDLLIFPLHLMDNYFDLFTFTYLKIILFTYSLIVFIFSISKSTSTGLTHVLIGTGISSVIAFITIAIIHAIFIYVGFLAVPELP